MATAARLTIREVSARTGVPVETLRVWERRYGVPAPVRLPSGHRRYSEHDVELVRRAAAEREAGAAPPVALERATYAMATPTTSLFAVLRRRHPHLETRVLRKPIMAALSHAIEDESLSRAERPLLFASFQRQRYYRQAERRWRDLAAGAASAAVFADFSELRTPPGGPCEIPVGDGEPLRREWVVACVAAGHAACLAAWEPAAERERAERERRFEAIWTVEPAIVAEAVRTCATIAARHVPALAETVLAHLDAAPVPAAADQLRLAAAITNRTLALVDDGV